MNSAPEVLNLPSLQSKMKCDPGGYECELVLLYNQFKSSMELFKQQASLHFTSVGGIGSDPSVAKDLSDRAMFLAHVTPFYPEHLVEFPKQLADLLNSSSKSLPSGLRCHIAKALILLINRKVLLEFCTEICSSIFFCLELDNFLRNICEFWIAKPPKAGET